MNEYVIEALRIVREDSKAAVGDRVRKQTAPDDLPEAARWVREVRARHGIPQSDLAYAIGTTQAYLSAIECGRRELSERFRRRIQRIDNLIGD